MAEGMVEVKYDKAQLERVRRLLREVPNQMPTVMSRGINITAKSAKAEIVRQIAAKAKIKQKAIRKAIILHKATRRIWQATLNITRRKIPLINYGARETKKRGVSYKGAEKVYLGKEELKGATSPIELAFIETMPRSGHKGVFRRKTAKTKRLAILELFGPNIADVFEGAAGIARDVQRTTAKKLEKNIDAQIKYILEKRRTTG